jgi:ATP-dependent Clp protease ATP-binding subunit ClpX
VIARDRPTHSVCTALEIGNILMVGGTGCGKSLLAKTLARIVDVPFAIVDATTLSETGFVGGDVDSVAAALVEAAAGDIDRAEKGIVYIDEIDTIAALPCDVGVRDSRSSETSSG